MRNEEMIVLGLAGMAAWFIFKGRSGAASSSAGYSTTYTGKAAPDYQGWQYFTDGTSISPEGRYYHNGLMVWAP